MGMQLAYNDMQHACTCMQPLLPDALNTTAPWRAPRGLSPLSPPPHTAPRPSAPSLPVSPQGAEAAHAQAVPPQHPTITKLRLLT